jgi:curved DNA-binding protein CbpA
VAGGVDPYEVLGVRRGADQAEIHAAYRAAVRRTHPDAGGSAAAFEAVQDAYETLRNAPAGRRPRPAAAEREPSRPGAPPSDAASKNGMEALLAESRRLEDEARRLAGLPPRQRADAAGEGGGGGDGVAGDSVGAILRDAGQQVRAAAEDGARELRRRLRRML